VQCASGGETFWGCCKSNPCNQGSQCPSGDLVPAFVDRPGQLSAYSPTGGTTPTSTSSTPSSSGQSSITTTVTSSSIIFPTSSSVSPSVISSSYSSHSANETGIGASSGQKNHTAAIAGGAVGGGLGFAILLGLVIYFILHARKSRNQHRDNLSRRQSNIAITMAEKSDVGGSPAVLGLTDQLSHMLLC